MTTTRERLQALPDVPTAREIGWPQMESLAAWSALAGPPRLPSEVVERWSHTLEQLSRDPAWLAGNEKLGGIPAIRSPSETEKFVREQYELYENLAERLGLRQ
jgi:tripartite-type tricarboxylate transporter receptor subunit TctC